MYRKLYFDFYDDNHYRAGHGSAPIFEQDMFQLKENIKVLAAGKALILSLQNIIMKECFLHHLPTDKFNFQAEDSDGKRKFAEMIDTPESIFENVKDMYDDLTIGDMNAE